METPEFVGGVTEETDFAVWSILEGNENFSAYTDYMDLAIPKSYVRSGSALKEKHTEKVANGLGNESVHSSSSSIQQAYREEHGSASMKQNEVNDCVDYQKKWDASNQSQISDSTQNHSEVYEEETQSPGSSSSSQQQVCPDEHGIVSTKRPIDGPFNSNTRKKPKTIGYKIGWCAKDNPTIAKRLQTTVMDSSECR